jgi:hypothetical protein
MHGVIGLQEVQTSASEFSLSHDQVHRIKIPFPITDQYVGKAARDFEIMAQLLRDKPKQMQQLLQAVCEGRNQDAQHIAKSLGLSEHQIAQQGGGQWWFVVWAIIVAIIIVAS